MTAHARSRGINLRPAQNRRFADSCRMPQFVCPKLSEKFLSRA